MSKFPKTYHCLSQQVFTNQNYSITPIRLEDRFDIMKWRNEQMYHLRQVELLTSENQDNYFKTVVSKLFKEIQPKQILMSFFKNDEFIGYGGLVHINWVEKTAEISFIMNTQLEKTEFALNWGNYLRLIEKLAFNELKLNTIFTYAYDLRPHLYPILEENGFSLKSRLKNHINIDGEDKDVLIHEKQNVLNTIRLRNSLKSDSDLIFNWSNDELVRSQSYNTNKIELAGHKAWYNDKFQNSNYLFLILEQKNTPFGLVRFTIEKTSTTIGVLIDKNYRGKGLSIKSIQLACTEYFKLNKQTILAYIKKSNKASVSAFSKAGFKLLREESIEGIPSYVYELKDNKNV
jgi:RimJ/RimL family protein N-acetyltransferase